MLSRWLARGVDALTTAGPRIDAVNVFPVADRDTGTNCLLTLRGAADEVAGLGDDTDTGAVLGAMARGALLAARGNSGMILSHWLAGLAAGGSSLAAALSGAARSARSAVLEPEEGTVLTLASEIARAARDAERTTQDEDEVLRVAVGAGHAALATISAQHPVLRDARVPDAGACALLVLLSAWQRTETVDLGWLPDRPAAHDRDAPEVSGFEVMAVLPAGDDTLLRRRLAEVGDSVAVVTEQGEGSRLLRQSHVHCADPSAAVAVMREAAGSAPVVAVVQALSGSPRAVAVTSGAQLSAELAVRGAVVLVVESAGGAAGPLWSLAMERAVRDAATGGAHRDGQADGQPVPVLPGQWADSCAAVLPEGAVLIAEADDEERALAVLRALDVGAGHDTVAPDAQSTTGEVPA